MAGYLGPKAIQYNVDNSNVTNDSNVGGDLTVGSSVRIGGQTGTLRLGEDATYHADIEWEYFNNELAFTTNNTGNFTFNSDGIERMRIQSGGGISFNGDTAEANALDDYEEGTWTPTSTGAGSLTVNAGAYYTKVGRNVTIHLNSATFSNATSTNALGVGGLPFESGDSSAVGVTMMSRRNDTLALVCFIAANTPDLRFYLSSTTGGFVRLTHNIFSDINNALYLSITYQTA